MDDIGQSNAALYAAIAVLAKELKMPTVGRELPSLARQAQDGGWPFEELVHRVLDTEVKSRRQSSATSRLRAAKFPDLKTFEQLDWKALKGVSRPKLQQLATCD